MDRGVSEESGVEEMNALEYLGILLKEFQASIQIDWLADHGWQVTLSNPGGKCSVHACEGDQKWPSPEDEPSLASTVQKAVDQAISEGWW